MRRLVFFSLLVVLGWQLGAVELETIYALSGRDTIESVQKKLGGVSRGHMDRGIIVTGRSALGAHSVTFEFQGPNKQLSLVRIMFTNMDSAESEYAKYTKRFGEPEVVTRTVSRNVRGVWMDVKVEKPLWKAPGRAVQLEPDGNGGFWEYIAFLP